MAAILELALLARAIRGAPVVAASARARSELRIGRAPGPAVRSGPAHRAHGRRAAVRYSRSATRPAARLPPSLPCPSWR